MTRSLLLSCAMFAALAGAAMAQTSLPRADSATSPASIIPSDRNIFSRLRSAPPRQRDESISGPRAASPHAPLFIGVMQEQGRSVGFLEIIGEDGTRTLLKVRPGDSLPFENMHVDDISLDSIQVTGIRGSRTIALGRDFNNQPAPAVQPPRLLPLAPRQPMPFRQRGTPSPSLRMPGAAPADPALPPGTLDMMEQRMRERRSVQDSVELPPR